MDTIKIVGNPLYQWELGRKVQLFPLPSMTVDEVHFSNYGDPEALVVKPKEENGMIIAEIPNILLQSGNNIVVYSVNVAEGFTDTLRSCVFNVRKRAKPSDYVYTEVEILNYETLEKRMKIIEENGVSEEQISTALEKYLDENPVQAGATAEESAQIQANTKAIEELQKGITFSVMPLTFSGAVNAVYDGTEPVNVNIPLAPSGYGGGLSITDDGAGNVSIASTGSVTITDDGVGNVTIV